MKRRSFLKLCGGTIAAYCLCPVAFSRSSTHAEGAKKNLLIIELKGGNDGLNTVVPYADKSYYEARPNISVPKEDVITLTDKFGLHPNLEAMKGLWDSGMVAIVLGVGYPEPDLSHFRSTDIWQGASTDEAIYTGWLGRYMDLLTKEEEFSQTAYPLGMEMKNSASLIMKGEDQSGIALSDPGVFLEIKSGLLDVPRLEPGVFPGGDELRFIKDIEKATDESAAAIQDAWEKGENAADYPDGSLGQDLSAVARLIKGGLGTGIYVVSLSGFDTHVNQLSVHPGLLQQVGDGISAFFDDLGKSGEAESVVVMTTSEFGRRVKDNGSGTDHGTASVHFVIGGGVKGGLYGEQPSLTDLDSSGNLKFTVDFRQMFSSVLRGYLNCSQSQCQKVLEGEFEPLPIFT